MADFMWHSHMQDNAAYKEDVVNCIQRHLDHNDEVKEEELKKYLKKTQKLRKEVFMMGDGINLKMYAKDVGVAENIDEDHEEEEVEED